MILANDTAFQKCHFKNTKLVGVSFENCKPFLLEFSFENCNLNLTHFGRLKIAGTHYKNCNLIEANFEQAFLREAIFQHCDLDHAVFYKTDLTKADFTTAANYNIDPENNILKEARFSYPNCKGLLSKYDIIIE
jgi:uncharacterized protein YjbI with pentapeptide repeats